MSNPAPNSSEIDDKPNNVKQSSTTAAKGGEKNRTPEQRREDLKADNFPALLLQERVSETSLRNWKSEGKYKWYPGPRNGFYGKKLEVRMHLPCNYGTYSFPVYIRGVLGYGKLQACHGHKCISALQNVKEAFQGFGWSSGETLQASCRDIGLGTG
jgi:hypothetical protein